MGKEETSRQFVIDCIDGALKAIENVNPSNADLMIVKIKLNESKMWFNEFTKGAKIERSE